VEGIPSALTVKSLVCQTAVAARIEPKGLFGELPNPPCAHSLRNSEIAPRTRGVGLLATGAPPFLARRNRLDFGDGRPAKET
jgi:hypothetical protein